MPKRSPLDIAMPQTVQSAGAQTQFTNLLSFASLSSSQELSSSSEGIVESYLSSTEDLSRSLKSGSSKACHCSIGFFCAVCRLAHSPLFPLVNSTPSQPPWGSWGLHPSSPDRLTGYTHIFMTPLHLT